MTLVDLILLVCREVAIPWTVSHVCDIFNKTEMILIVPITIMHTLACRPTGNNQHTAHIHQTILNPLHGFRRNTWLGIKGDINGIDILLAKLMVIS